MWKWFPKRWRIPLAAKMVLLVLVALIPYLLLVRWVLRSLNEVGADQQRIRLSEIAIDQGHLLGDEAAQIQARLRGIVESSSMSDRWYGLQFAESAEAAGANQQALLRLVKEDEIIAGFDYLALTLPDGSRYVAFHDRQSLPVSEGSFLARLASQGYGARTSTSLYDWNWAIEFHQESALVRPEPYLLVATPVYYLNPVSDEWVLTGFIAGGRRLTESMLGNRGEADTLVTLASATGESLWSTTDEGPALLAAFTAEHTLDDSRLPFDLTLETGEKIACAVALHGMAEQSTAWHEPVYLLAAQTANPITEVIAQAQAQLISASLAIAIFAVLFALLLAANLSEPLRGLAHVVNRYARGESAPYTVPETRDEVEVLGSAFVAMVDDRERATARLVQAERLAAWRDVARKLAHEIKNPLQPIRLQIENLVRIGERKPEKIGAMLPDAAEIVLFEVERLRRLADEFAAFARMPQAILEPTPLAPLLQHAVDLVTLQHPTIEYTVTLPPGLPSLALDREKVTQALINLLKNAAEALLEGGIADPAIACSAGPHASGGLEIVIADNGPGISEEAQASLFTPYFTTKDAGTGLGLVVVQQVMAEHEGKITVDSAPGEGTTCTLLFPASLIVSPQ